MACKLSEAVPKFNRQLGRVSNFNQSINWHHHMKDHVEIGHLTKYDALGWTETKLWTLKYGSKSIQTSLMLRQSAPKSDIFMISMILLKMGKQSDFHLSFFQIAGAFQAP